MGYYDPNKGKGGTAVLPPSKRTKIEVTVEAITAEQAAQMARASKGPAYAICHKIMEQMNSKSGSTTFIASAVHDGNELTDKEIKEVKIQMKHTFKEIGSDNSILYIDYAKNFLIGPRTLIGGGRTRGPARNKN